jgi:hypothetical protein
VKTKRALPPLPSNVGKRGKAVMPPDRRVLRFTITDEVRSFADSRRTKVVVLQLVRFDDGRKEVRLGYYIIGKKPKMRGRWVWGQYATFMLTRVFQSLIRKAIERQWFSARFIA